MYKAIALLMLISFVQMDAELKKLPEKYLVSYGDPDAPTKIVEYFSFQCPHCLALFRRDFKKIEETFVEPKKVHWIFHPIPTDLVTLQGMICMASLGDHQKKLYLETLLEEADAGKPEFTTLIMSKAMEILGKPIPELRNEDFLQNSEAYLDAFSFLSQEVKIHAVPTIEVNVKLFPKDVPDYEFVQSIVKD